MHSPQACGRFHNVEEFEGTKRSCRRKLKRHNERRSEKKAALKRDAAAWAAVQCSSAAAPQQSQVGVGSLAQSSGTAGLLQAPAQACGHVQAQARDSGSVATLSAGLAPGPPQLPPTGLPQAVPARHIVGEELVAPQSLSQATAPQPPIPRPSVPRWLPSPDDSARLSQASVLALEPQRLPSRTDSSRLHQAVGLALEPQRLPSRDDSTKLPQAAMPASDVDFPRLPRRLVSRNDSRLSQAVDAGAAGALSAEQQAYNRLAVEQLLMDMLSPAAGQALAHLLLAQDADTPPPAEAAVAPAQEVEGLHPRPLGGGSDRKSVV